jgi:NAD(P)H-dependent flavin oxidoreductase YrpB (nitropropane dioxygenase family)
MAAAWSPRSPSGRKVSPWARASCSRRRARCRRLAYRKLTGASIRELVASALAMQRSDKLTRSQLIMAANAPVLVRKAMIEGDPIRGVLPSGQVAGVIDDRPSVAELVDAIVKQAEERLAALAK